MKLGPALPKVLYAHSMVEVGGNLYIIGGDDGYSGFFLKEIHKFTCVSGSCSWTKLNQQVKVDRSHTVVIPVMDSFCTPN